MKEKMDKKLTVMVIEDEAVLLDAIIKKLGLSDIEAIPCRSGGIAIEYLTKKKVRPDVIWLDYYLGDMNGLIFMRRLRESGKWDDIPVVVVSNSASNETVENMAKFGVEKYLLKAEHRLDDIIQIIKDMLTNPGGGGNG